MEFNSLDFCLHVKTIITLNEALEKIKQLKNTYYFRRESEKVALPDSMGREISEDIIADMPRAMRKITIIGKGELVNVYLFC